MSYVSSFKSIDAKLFLPKKFLITSGVARSRALLVVISICGNEDTDEECG